MRAVTRDGGLVVAVDPGLVTGLAVLHFPEMRFGSEQVEGRHAFYDTLNGVLGSGIPAELVCEKYVITQRSAQVSPQYDALYIIGHLDAVCHRLGIPFTLQTPAQAKSFASDDKLKRAGWYRATPGGHANDAARHLLRYVVRTYPADARPLLYPTEEAT